MAKKLDDVMQALPASRRKRIESRKTELARLKDLRSLVELTQLDLAQALGVGQDTVSRLENRSDMLLSTLHDYVECLGGTLELVVRFPGRPPLLIDPRDESSRSLKRSAKSSGKQKVNERARANR